MSSSTPHSASRSPALSSSTRVRDLVAELGRVLEAARTPEAHQEARDIVAALLDMPRFWPSLHPDEIVADDVVQRARDAATLRARGAPFAYAVERAAFRHLTLHVDERVLIPRQETELLVDLVLQAGLPAGGVAVDVGTGSGCLALSLAHEGRFARIVATDVSLDALAVARRNAAELAPSLRAPVELRHGASLAPVADVRARLIVSNPPYISFQELSELPSSVRDWEPSLALSCAREGLAISAEIVRGAPEHLERGGMLALEVDTRRASLVAELVAADARYENVAVHLDLTGRERFVTAHRR